MLETDGVDLVHLHAYDRKVQLSPFRYQLLSRQVYCGLKPLLQFAPPWWAQLDEFIGIVKGVMADGMATHGEVEFLLRWDGSQPPGGEPLASEGAVPPSGSVGGEWCNESSGRGRSVGAIDEDGRWIHHTAG